MINELYTKYQSYPVPVKKWIVRAIHGVSAGLIAGAMEFYMHIDEPDRMTVSIVMFIFGLFGVQGSLNQSMPRERVEREEDASTGEHR